jgi:hypothetical protein
MQTKDLSGFWDTLEGGDKEGMCPRANTGTPRTRELGTSADSGVHRWVAAMKSDRWALSLRGSPFYRVTVAHVQSFSTSFSTSVLSLSVPVAFETSTEGSK